MSSTAYRILLFESIEKMLAADRSLLEVNLRQSAIKLREKELNLFTENYNSMATQAAVLAGFTTTCLIEITVPEDTNIFISSCLHILAAISICANITCVSLSTIGTFNRMLNIHLLGFA